MYVYCTNTSYYKVTKGQPKTMICRCNTWNTCGPSKNTSVNYSFSSAGIITINQ